MKLKSTAMSQASNSSLTPAIAEEIYKRNLELLEERRRAELFLYSVSEIVLAINEGFQITVFNQAAEVYFGFPRETIISTDARKIIKLKTEEGNEVSLQTLCFEGEPDKSDIGDLILETKSGTYNVKVNTSIIGGDGSLKECVVTIVDVTRETQLDNLKDEFISITSHELRTPITIIKSYLWMLDSGKAGELTEKQKGYLSKAIKGAERMLALINDTLNVSRIEQGKITLSIVPLDIKDFLSEFEEEFKIKTDEKKLWLKTEFPDELPKVLADKDKLREVFLNFLGNSIKFTQKGGITIKAETVKDDYVKVLVVDTGQGISQADIGRLFNKFGRLDNSFTTIANSTGTGLGLYITKSLVEKMGGQVGVFSDGIGKGSTFWFTLPIYNSSLKGGADAAENAAPYTDSAITSIVS